MSIGVIATIRVREGKNIEFETVFARLAEQVLKNEAGCAFYALHKSKADAQTYKILEQYKTEADLQAHGQTDYFKAANQELASVVAGPPDIELLDGVD